VRLVTWDVDGTLYSTRRVAWRLLDAVVRSHLRGRGSAARAELGALRRYQRLTEAHRATGGALGEEHRRIDRQALLRLEERWYRPAIARTGPRPGAREALAFVRGREIPQVASSDYLADYKLEALGLAGFFAATYAGETLGFVKPSPRGFERIATDFGIPTAAVLHIGDRPDTDGAAAAAAGCRALILGRDFRSFSELLALLRRT